LADCQRREADEAAAAAAAAEVLKQEQKQRQAEKMKTIDKTQAQSAQSKKRQPASNRTETNLPDDVSSWPRAV